MDCFGRILEFIFVIFAGRMGSKKKRHGCIRGGREESVEEERGMVVVGRREGTAARGE